MTRWLFLAVLSFSLGMLLLCTLGYDAEMWQMLSGWVLIGGSFYLLCLALPDEDAT